MASDEEEDISLELATHLSLQEFARESASNADEELPTMNGEKVALLDVKEESSSKRVRYHIVKAGTKKFCNLF